MEDSTTITRISTSEEGEIPEIESSGIHQKPPRKRGRPRLNGSRSTELSEVSHHSRPFRDIYYLPNIEIESSVANSASSKDL